MFHRDYRISSSRQQLSLAVSNTEHMQLRKKEPASVFSDSLVDNIVKAQNNDHAAERTYSDYRASSYGW